MPRQAAAWCAATVVAARLWLPARADAHDIHIELFEDTACIKDKISELLLRDNQCYAGTFSALTKAYTVKIVGFKGNGVYDLSEYVDDCNELYSAPRRMQGGLCVPWFSPMQYAKASLKLRSNVCQEDCSKLSLAVQTFYKGDSCEGDYTSLNSYPVQGECLRYWNGTQTFGADVQTTKVFQTVYPGSDDCTGDIIETYQMKADCTVDEITPCCMSLHTDAVPGSFSWHIEKYPEKALTSFAQRPVLRRLAFAALSSSALLLHWVDLFATP